jgi:peptidoglycan hydrolase CwlO-like protein
MTGSQLENKNNDLSSLRASIDEIYNEIRDLEKENFEEDHKANDIAEKSKDCAKVRIRVRVRVRVR